MKKVLIISAAAAIALVSCAKVTDQYVGAPESREIAFSPLAQPATKAAAYSAVSDANFPDNYVMQVSANVNDAGAYFHDVTFGKGTTTWKGSPAQYWPLSASTLNFLAVTEWPASYSKDIVATTFTSSSANGASVVLGNNSPATVDSQAGAQHDLMYAVGRGIVQQSGNALSYTGNAAGDAAPVDMQFKHALAWVNFTVKTAASYTGFKLNSITLHNAYYGGTYTIDNSANKDYTYDGSTYDSKVPTAVTGSWTSGSQTNQGANVEVPGWTSGTAVSTTPAAVGNGLIIVPTYGFDPAVNSFTGFTISYEFNNQTFSYTHTENVTVEQAKKYTYAITFTLTEIEINPSVATWTNVDSTPVAIPGA